MNFSIKKFNVIFIFVAVLILCGTQIPTVQSIETDAENKGLIFAKDVIMLDMAKYDVTLDSYSIEFPEKLAGRSREYVTYTLNSENNVLDMACVITENTLTYCRVRTVEGTPVYTHSSMDALFEAKDILQRYRSYKQDSSLNAITDLLDTIDGTKNMTTTLDNVKQDVLIEPDATSFVWRYTYNGAEYTGIDVTFREGYIAFRDDRSIYAIGNTNVHITEKEAIRIALNCIENVSYRVRFADESWVEVSDFKIVEENITAGLATRSKEALLLYPYWNVLLPFDDVYPGYIWAFSVTIWADSGEIIDYRACTTGGDLAMEQTQVSVPEPVDNTIYTVIIFTIAIALSFIAATKLFKRIRK